VFFRNPNGENVQPEDEVWPRYNSLSHASISLNRTDRIIYNTPDHWIGPARELVWKDPTNNEPTTSDATGTPDPGQTSSTGTGMTDDPSNTTKDPGTSTGTGMTDDPSNTTKDPGTSTGTRISHLTFTASLISFVLVIVTLVT